ncbi:hypothetical protein ACHQM5_005223 [Ranunculus cassubicifolius]
MVISNTTDWSFSSLHLCREILTKTFNGSSNLLISPHSNYRSFSVNSSVSPLVLEESREYQITEIDKKFAENSGNLNDFIRGLSKDRQTEALAFEYYLKAKTVAEFRPNELTIKLLIRLITSCIKARKFRMIDILLGVFESEETIAIPAFESAMKGYNKLHMYSSTILVFDRMNSSGVLPDEGCYCQIMEAYNKTGNVDKVVSVFNDVKGMASFGKSRFSSQIFGILCDSLGKSGRAFEALEVYREMLGKGIITESSTIFSSLICSFASIREVEIAESLFKEAKEMKMVKDPALFLKLVLMYVEEGSIEKTLEIIQAMKILNIKVTDCIFCAVVNGYSKKRGLTETVKIYEELVSSSIDPGQVTYASIINVYCRLGLYEKAEMVFSEMENKGFVKCVVAYSSMVSMYGKTGRLKDAMKLVAKMKERGCEPNVWVYNSLMDMHVNNLRQVEKFWKEMRRRKILPDKVSYTSIIKAYNKAREFEECLRYYTEFRANGGVIDRKLAGIMVGVFSKSNRVDELVKLLQDMKGERMVLDVRLYRSALNALRDAGLESQVKLFEENFNSSHRLSSKPVKGRPLLLDVGRF